MVVARRPRMRLGLSATQPPAPSPTYIPHVALRRAPPRSLGFAQTKLVQSGGQSFEVPFLEVLLLNRTEAQLNIAHCRVGPTRPARGTAMQLEFQLVVTRDHRTCARVGPRLVQVYWVTLTSRVGSGYLCGPQSGCVVLWRITLAVRTAMAHGALSIEIGIATLP